MATIAENLSRIQSAKADIKTAIEARGVTVPSSATIDTYDDYISQIPSGSTTELKGIIERSISSITIPDDVTSIGRYAFHSCSSLTNVNIPSGVTSIGDSAFENCSGLTAITINATTPPTLGASVFYNTNNCPIYVPCDSVSTYKVASGWSTLAGRIAGIPPCDTPVDIGILADYTCNNTDLICCQNFPTPLVVSGNSVSYSGISFNSDINYYRLGSIPVCNLLPAGDEYTQHTDTISLTDGSEIYSITFILQERALSVLSGAMATYETNYNSYIGQPSGVNIPVPTGSYPYTSLTYELKSGGTAATSFVITATGYYRLTKIYIIKNI